MLVKTIDTATELRNEFAGCDRDYYSWGTYEALIDYFDNQEKSTELDVIAICCDLSENSYKEVISDYNLDIDATNEEVLDYLKDHTCILWYDNDVVSYWVF